MAKGLKSDLSYFKKIFPKRKRSSHKGDFGKLLILAGSRRMVGCAVLAVEAALRSGTGLLTLGFPESLHWVYTKRLTEAMFLPLSETVEGTLAFQAAKDIQDFLLTQDVLALGPGLSRNLETQKLIRKLVAGSPKPFVLDADGLFPFSGKASSLKKISVPFVLTPHPGEFERLFGFKAGETLSKRKQAAQKACQISGGVVVLKGYETIVADPKGRLYVNKTGNAGLAKGGTGDVLFGMIASFVGQGLDPFQAACLGVFLHGLAADLAVRKIPKASLLAGDLAQFISEAIRKIQ